jgi:hypothetical protein
VTKSIDNIKSKITEEIGNILEEELKKVPPVYVMLNNFNNQLMRLESLMNSVEYSMSVLNENIKRTYDCNTVRVIHPKPLSENDSQ